VPLLGKGQTLSTELKLQFLELNILPAINPSPGPKLLTIRSFRILIYSLSSTDVKSLATATFYP
jgi:hypothetical protein